MDVRPTDEPSGPPDGGPVVGAGASSSRLSFTETLQLAIAAATIAAAWQLAVVARLALAGEITHVGLDFAWMVPAANLVLWLSVATPSALFALLLPRRLALRLGTTGFFSLAALSILLPQGHIARYAVALLSLGMGLAVARLVVDRPVAWLRRFRVLSVSLLMTMACSAGAIILRDTLIRWQASAALPAAKASAPNVVLIVIDAGRADALSSYGYARGTTPSLDALVKEGTLFERAMSTAPWTLPSHVTMFSGRFVMPDRGGTQHFRRPMRKTFPVLAEAFRDAGYETAGFVGNLYYTGRDTHLDRGFITYHDYQRTWEELLRSSTFAQTTMARELFAADTWREAWQVLKQNDFTVPVQPEHARKPATVVTNEFLDFLDQRTARPYFAFLNYFDAHTTYDPPDEFATKFAAAPVARDLYDGSYSYIDAEIGRLVASLQSRGELDSTIIVVTGDHGELFGEHGLYEHTSNLYFPVLHVPLIVRYPSRVPAGLRVRAPVSLRDLAATLSDLAGLTREPPFPGVSLAGSFNSGSGGPRSPVFAAVERGIRSDSGLPFTRGAMQSLVDGHWQLIRTAGVDEFELYDNVADPDQTRNLATDAEFDSVGARLQSELERLLQLGPEASLNDMTTSPRIDTSR